MVGAVQEHPERAVLGWGALTGFRDEEEMLQEAVGRFIAEVADLFERYRTPAPPWRVQIANLRRAAPETRTEDGSR